MSRVGGRFAFSIQPICPVESRPKRALIPPRTTSQTPPPSRFFLGASKPSLDGRETGASAPRAVTALGGFWSVELLRETGAVTGKPPERPDSPEGEEGVVCK